MRHVEYLLKFILVLGISLVLICSGEKQASKPEEATPTKSPPSQDVPSDAGKPPLAENGMMIRKWICSLGSTENYEGDVTKQYCKDLGEKLPESRETGQMSPQVETQLPQLRPREKAIVLPNSVNFQVIFLGCQSHVI